MTGPHHGTVRPHDSREDPDGIECRECAEPFDLKARDMDDCPNCGFEPEDANVRRYPIEEIIWVAVALIMLPFGLLMVLSLL